MKYKTCPDCGGMGERFVYSVDVGGPQPEEYPPCDTCDGECQVIDWKATALDFEQRLAVVEAFVVAMQRRESRRGLSETSTAGRWRISPEQTNDY